MIAITGGYPVDDGETDITTSFDVRIMPHKEVTTMDRTSDPLFPFVDDDITEWMTKHKDDDSGYGLNEAWRSQSEDWNDGEFRIQISRKAPQPDIRVLDIAIARTLCQYYDDNELPWYASFDKRPAQFSSQYDDWRWTIGHRLTIGELYFILTIIFQVVWDNTTGWDYKTVALYPSLVKETLLTRADSPVVLTKLSSEWRFNDSGVYSDTFRPGVRNYKLQNSMHWLNFFYYDHGVSPREKANPGDTQGWSWSVGVTISGGGVRPLIGPSYNGFVFDLGSISIPVVPKSSQISKDMDRTKQGGASYSYNIDAFLIRGNFVTDEFSEEQIGIDASILTLAPGDDYTGDEVINWLKSHNINDQFFSSHTQFQTQFLEAERRGRLYRLHFRVTGK